MKRLVLILLCALLALPFGCAGEKSGGAPAAETPADRSDAAAETGGTVGDLSFDTVTLYGEPISAEIVKGYDLVIVNYWAEWCGPCVGELGELERIRQEYPNVLILGVLTGTDGVDLAKATLERAGVTYPTLEPSGSLIAMSRRSQYITATYFFNGDGVEIGSEVIGAQDYEGWKATVEGLLP